MKKIHLLIALLFVIMHSVQAQEIQYSYDAAGNRIQRKVLVQRSSENNENNAMNPITDVKGEYTFTLSPNPTSGEFQIKADASFMLLEGKRLIVHDLNGRLVKEIPFSETQRSIDLTNQQSGSYIVRLVATNGYAIEWQVIKE